MQPGNHYLKSLRILHPILQTPAGMTLVKFSQVVRCFLFHAVYSVCVYIYINMCVYIYIGLFYIMMFVYIITRSKSFVPIVSCFTRSTGHKIYCSSLLKESASVFSLVQMLVRVYFQTLSMIKHCHSFACLKKDRLTLLQRTRISCI